MGGVHTLGHPNEFNSMFRHYPWTSQGKNQLNNMYYVNIVNTTNYRYTSPKRLYQAKGEKMPKCGLPISYYFGDEHGEGRDVAFRVRSEMRTESYGPWNWNLHGRKCNKALCATLLAQQGEYDTNSCCHWVDYCTTHPDDCPFGNAVNCRTVEGDQCADFVFMRINMLSPDVGLFFNFTVDETGRPRGCAGLDDATRWLENRDRHSQLVSCELNTAQADNQLNMAEVMQLYADDNQVWVQDFMQVFQTMLENGVDEQQLVSAPQAWFSAKCRRNKCREQ